MEDEIVSIEEIGERETIDICVSHNNLFYANDILTHNSATNESNPGLETTSESMGLSMTADVQLSLWANEEDKEAGILHMGMQKNRFGPNFGKTALKINWNNLSVVETEDSIFDNEDLQSAKSILDTL